MGLDFSTLVYLPAQEMFGRSVTITPADGSGAYTNRGIYNRNSLNVQLDDASIINEQETILDIRNAEYPVIPVQGDTVTIPADGAVPALGDFQITNVFDNGGGETTLYLRKLI